MLSYRDKRKMRKGLFLVAVMGAVTVLPISAAVAHAAGGAWSAPDCGAEPAMPTLDVSSVEHYNASVDKATAYQKAARAYNTCVAKAANKQETAISNEAKEKIAYVHEGSLAVQKHIAANFTRMTATLKAGSSKFAGK